MIPNCEGAAASILMSTKGSNQPDGLPSSILFCYVFRRARFGVIKMDNFTNSALKSYICAMRRVHYDLLAMYY